MFWWRGIVGADGIRLRSERREKRLMGFARRGESGVEPAIFENVSDEGCCIRGEFRIGECLVITLPKVGTVGAQVRWSLGGRAGLRFDRAS